MGVAFGDTLFVGDAFLTLEILDKHRIPFYTDIQVGLMTLATLKQRSDTFKHIVAGHSAIYSAGQRAHQAIDYMAQRLESILDTVRLTLADGSARWGTEILSAVAQAQGASISTLSQQVLYQTTVQSALSALYTRGEIHQLFQENRLLWRMGSLK